MAAARNRTIALLVTLLVLAAGCSRDATEPSPTASLSTAAATEPSEPPTEVASEDPYAIPADPADIDEAYVERVLEALLLPVADAVRVTVSSGRVTPQATQILEATHGGKSLVGIERALRRVAALKGRAQPFRADPSGTDITVQKVISAGRSCIFTLVLQDTTGLVKQEIDPFPGYYHLAINSATDSSGINPTPWMIVADAEPRADGKQYKDPCK